MSDNASFLVELFSSIQGEGIFAGYRQVFVRFAGCNLTCSYCDTPTEPFPSQALVESTPGRRDFLVEPNPVPLRVVVDLLQRWLHGWPGVHHSISITGGEPLRSEGTLLEWLPALRSLLPIYLETNGVLHQQLKNVLSFVDFISMDIKLPSTSGCTDLWEDHRQFLSVAADRDVVVKLVVSDETEDWEVEKAMKIVASQRQSIPCILQPVTRRDGTVGITPLRLLEMQEILSQLLSDVRVIPQTHKFMQQL